MIIFCTESFKAEYKKLNKQNAYRILENEIIDNFFNCSDDQIFHGVKMSGPDDKMVVKKRIGGRGGFRVYFYAYIHDKIVYLYYLYPKTGPAGKVSLNSKFEAIINNEAKKAIDYNELLEMSVVDGRLNFANTKLNDETVT
jgi:mRNA-degrading endonuclease RelE of RelBE toxin-antitoxin system